METKVSATCQATHLKTSTRNSRQVKIKSKTKTKHVINTVTVVEVVVAVVTIKAAITVVAMIVNKEVDLIEEEVEVDSEEEIEDLVVIEVDLAIEEEVEEVEEGADLMVEEGDMEVETEGLQVIEVGDLEEEVVSAIETEIGTVEVTIISLMIGAMEINSMDKEMEGHTMTLTIRIQAIALVITHLETVKHIQVNNLYLVLSMVNNLNMERFNNNPNNNFQQSLGLVYHLIQIWFNQTWHLPSIVLLNPPSKRSKDLVKLKTL